jgi:hypothetical protein
MNPDDKGKLIGINPGINWKDKYGIHKGKWLNEQLSSTKL